MIDYIFVCYLHIPVFSLSTTVSMMITVSVAVMTTAINTNTTIFAQVGHMGECPIPPGASTAGLVVTSLGSMYVYSVSAASSSKLLLTCPALSKS